MVYKEGAIFSTYGGDSGSGKSTLAIYTIFIGCKRCTSKCACAFL